MNDSNVPPPSAPGPPPPPVDPPQTPMAPPQTPMGPPQPPMGPPLANPADRVNGPAIGLIVTAVIGAVLAIFGLVWHLAFGAAAGLGAMGDEYNRFSHLFSGAIGIVSAVIGLIIAAVILWAALEMRKLQSWGLALTASILAMIPCISPCCILGIPIGIWSLVVLTKPEVKAAFH